jgi:type I restriction enzyme S subunit
LIPNGWQEKKIFELTAALEAGASVNGEDRFKQQDEVGVLKVSAVTYGRFDEYAYKVVSDAEERGRLFVNPTRDSIIVSRANTLELVGASAYIDKDYFELFLPDKLWKITTKDGHSARWLSHILSMQTTRSQISNRATGTSGSMKNISQDAFLSIPVLTPPLAEQRKIAAILGTWDAAIDRAERLVAALKARKKALMQRLLTGEVRFAGFEGEWEEKNFSEVLTVQMGGTPSRSNPDYWDAEKISENRWLSIADLKEKYVSDSSEYITDLGAQKSNTRLFAAGTVVMSFKLTIGRAAILAKPCYTNEAICALTPKDKTLLSSRFLYHALSVVDFERELDQAVKGRTLNKEKLQRLRLRMPPVKEQEQIAQLGDSLDAQIEMQVSHVRCLQRQKRGLMQRLLTGEVRVAVDG